jgi:uncharacterized membrane protein YiaA
MLALISLFFMGFFILNYHNSIHGFFAVAFLVVGIVVFLVGLFKKVVK